MVSCDTLILGSGCWSAGAALSGRGSLLVVDRGAVIGAEYFDTFRPTSGWKSELRSAEARELYRRWPTRGGIDGRAQRQLSARAVSLQNADSAPFEVPALD